MPASIPAKVFWNLKARDLPKGVFALMYQLANARDVDPPPKSV